MNTRQEKMMRLADVARKYYIEDKKQSDIAKELGVSRPLISRMLTEAKALGLVEITIHDPWQRSAVFLEKLQKRWQIQDAVLQEDLEDDRSTNIMLSESTIGLLEKSEPKRLVLAGDISLGSWLLGWNSILRRIRAFRIFIRCWETQVFPFGIIIPMKMFEFWLKIFLQHRIFSIFPRCRKVWRKRNCSVPQNYISSLKKTGRK